MLVSLAFALAGIHVGAHRVLPFGYAPAWSPNGARRAVLEGTSLGFTDRYPAFYGQNVNITSLPRGVYDLVHRANETMAIHELRYENDAASARIRISWHKGVPGVTVLRRCQSTTTC